MAISGSIGAFVIGVSQIGVFGGGGGGGGGATLGGTDLKSVALAQWGPNVLVATWYIADAWYATSNNILRATAVSATISGVGFNAACTDASSGVYMAARDHSQVTYLASGGAVTIYHAASGITFTGAAMASGHPYFVDAQGNLTTLVGPSLTQLGAGFGAGQPTWNLGAIGNTLYTARTSSNIVETFTLTSQTAGTSGVLPGSAVPGVTCMTVSGRVAVGGLTPLLYNPNQTWLALEPTGGLLLGVQAASGTMTVYENNGAVWPTTQTLTGLGAAKHVTWAPNSQFAFASDNVNGNVRVFTNTFSVMASSQLLAAPHAQQAAILTDSLNGLVAQGINNTVLPLVFNGVTWSAGTALSGVPDPACVVALSATQAAVGYASGVALLTLAAGNWSVTASGALPYVPLAITTDGLGAIFTTGALGANTMTSMLSGTTLVNTVSGVGSPTSIYYARGQLVVADHDANLLRIYGVIAGQIVEQTASEFTFPAPTSIAGLGNTGFDVFVSGASGATLPYTFNAPYALKRESIGVVSIWDGAAWHNMQTGASIPMAMVWNPSATALYIATLDNMLFTVNASAVTISSGAIQQIPNQPQSVPLGISSMLWVGSALYGATSINDRLIQII